MIHVWLKNGNFEILRNVHELKNLIEAEVGKDVASEVEKLIDAANYTERKVDTDLGAYESHLDSFNAMCSDVLDILERLLKELESPRRLNRHALLKRVSGIKKLIENEI